MKYLREPPLAEEFVRVLKFIILLVLKLEGAYKFDWFEFFYLNQ